MPVGELESGIALNHINAIQNLMRAENCFLLVRPTEYDSTVFIKEGFPTKSMDVHSKSSNWGPMAGLVPVDQALSKKRTGLPNAKIHDNLLPQGVAEPFPLKYPVKMYQNLLLRRKFVLESGYYLDETRGRPVVRFARHDQEFPYHNVMCNFCSDPADVNNTLFCFRFEVDRVAVYWVSFPEGQRDFGQLVPVVVWCYRVGGLPKPVTGDYDIWMVAPYYTRIDEHCVVQPHTDEHGSSSATAYVNGLVERLNHACNRFDNPVFQHGAEAQNTGFTQKLDPHLVLFTPGGESYLIDSYQLAAYLKEMLRCGYLVCGNPQYAKDEPQIGGKDWFQKSDVLNKVLEEEKVFYNAMRRSSAVDTLRTQNRRQSQLKDIHAINKDKIKGTHDIKILQQTFESLLGADTPVTHLQEIDLPPDYVIFEHAEVSFLSDVCNRISQSHRISARDVHELKTRLNAAKAALTQDYIDGTKERECSTRL